MSNFTQLEADIVSMLATSDVDTGLFIRLAEQELNRGLRLQGMVSSTTLTPVLTGDRYIIALPSDFLEAFHVEQSYYRLTYQTPNGFDVNDQYRYNIVGTDIHVTGSDDIDLWYYGSETALSESNQTNLFTSKCYDGLLYLALGHAGVYLQDPRAQAFADTGIGLIKQAQDRDTEARMSGAPLIQNGA